MSIVENLFNKELINLPDRRHYLLWAEIVNTTATKQKYTSHTRESTQIPLASRTARLGSGVLRSCRKSRQREVV